MANEAGVRLLVLDHLLPGGLQSLASNVYLDGVRKNFLGEIEIAISRDQMVL